MDSANKRDGVCQALHSCLSILRIFAREYLIQKFFFSTVMKLLIVVAVAAMLLSAADARVTYGLVQNYPELSKCSDCLRDHCKKCDDSCRVALQSHECINCVFLECCPCKPACLSSEMVEVVDHN